MRIRHRASGVERVLLVLLEMESRVLQRSRVTTTRVIQATSCSYIIIYKRVHFRFNLLLNIIKIRLVKLNL